MLGVEKKADGTCTVNVDSAAGGKPDSIECDTVLVAIGRRPFTNGLGLEAAGTPPLPLVGKSPNTLVPFFLSDGESGGEISVRFQDSPVRLWRIGIFNRLPEF